MMRPASAPIPSPAAKCFPLEDPRRTSRRLNSRVPYRSRTQFAHRSTISEPAVSLLRCLTVGRLSVPTTNRIVAPGATVDGATSRAGEIPVSTEGDPPLHAAPAMVTSRATLTVLTIGGLGIFDLLESHMRASAKDVLSWAKNRLQDVESGSRALRCWAATGSHRCAVRRAIPIIPPIR